MAILGGEPCPSLEYLQPARWAPCSLQGKNSIHRPEYWTSRHHDRWKDWTIMSIVQPFQTLEKYVRRRACHLLDWCEVQRCKQRLKIELGVSMCQMSISWTWLPNRNVCRFPCHEVTFLLIQWHGLERIWSTDARYRKRATVRDRQRCHSLQKGSSTPFHLWRLASFLDSFRSSWASNTASSSAIFRGSQGKRISLTIFRDWCSRRRLEFLRQVGQD